jgi:hypothetical protein
VSYADDVLFGWRGVCIGCRRWRCAQLIYEDDDNITDLTPRNCSDYCWADQVGRSVPSGGIGPCGHTAVYCGSAGSIVVLRRRAPPAHC